MLDATELARRFNAAFPRGKGTTIDRKIASECGVTPQAVYGWRETGRIAKKHLLILAKMSGRSARYWLGEDVESGKTETLAPRERRLLAMWAYLTPQQKREYLQSLNALVRANREVAKHMASSRIDRTPDDEVADAFGSVDDLDLK